MAHLGVVKLPRQRKFSEHIPDELCFLSMIRNVKTKQQRAFRDAATGSSEDSDNNRKRKKKKINPTLNVTRTDIEEALVDLQIRTNVCVYPCETDEDVGTKIALFTKAVAERPYK